MIQLTVNGKRASFDGDPEMPLLWYLRDSLALTGTKFGCGMGLCGALHGASQRRGGPELPYLHERRGGPARHHDRGASQPAAEHPLQKAWQAANVPQCGYCQSAPDHAGRRHAPVQTEAHGPRYR